MKIILYFCILMELNSWYWVFGPQRTPISWRLTVLNYGSDSQYGVFRCSWFNIVVKLKPSWLLFMYFDIQCSTNVELSVLQQNQLTLSVEGWKLVDIKLKRWMACEPTANTSWQLIYSWNVEWLVNPQPIQVDGWYFWLP